MNAKGWALSGGEKFVCRVLTHFWREIKFNRNGRWSITPKNIQDWTCVGMKGTYDQLKRVESFRLKTCVHVCVCVSKRSHRTLGLVGFSMCPIFIQM